MTTLLRKVWESVSSRTNSSSSSSSPSSSDRRQQQQQLMVAYAESSTGAFDRIPFDIFMQILKILGPKESAKLSAVCKSWKLVVSDNRLWIYFLQNQHESWDSIFYAESHLRLGYPLQALPNQISQLSFMHIYGQRAQVPGSVIIDGGSGYCKYGWSKYVCPSGRSATFLEFGNIESPMYSRLRHFFATIYSRCVLARSKDIRRIEFQELHMYRMQVKTSAHPIIVSIPICHYDDTESAKAARRQLKETIHSVLFDMNVPAVCAINQATLALYAARRTSGIVVNIGFQQTSIVPILHGKVMRKVGVEVVGMGALKLTGFLRELMQQKNIHFESLYTVRSLKDNLCYVAFDYEAELSKDTQASLEVAAEGWFTLSKERFQTGEILFQPRIAGVRAMSLHQAVALCMDHCQAAELTGDDSWFKTVVLAGGSACLPGLAERLGKELQGLLPQSVSTGIRVISPPYGADSAWFGAKLISNLSTFPGPWCMTKKQFRRKSRSGLVW
ncbi:actin-related protein 8-like isoform X2 [Actinidia eriantha]|uniref:actin-related protein 8-like isoform X2 n=1 Tax=Actinidia eriantha TaxID=165200 RepID=UPI002586D1A7|nr:actin-related protein 8-like isoform X2 [Actinidia eriantha]